MSVSGAYILFSFSQKGRQQRKRKFQALYTETLYSVMYVRPRVQSKRNLPEGVPLSKPMVVSNGPPSAKVYRIALALSLLLEYEDENIKLTDSLKTKHSASSRSSVPRNSSQWI